MTDVHDRTLGEIVAANAGASRVLERFGLDYCCGGHRSLDQACAVAGVEASIVEAELERAPIIEAAWAHLDAPSLAHHIVDTHHRYLHEELPLLDALAAKVFDVHGDRHAELGTVRRLVAEIRADLEPHLMKEERVLFPAIEALAGGHTEFPFGSIANPIRMMGVEHDRAGELLAELHAWTDGYVVPDDACASYRSLYERLALLEADTHEHIHKENNVLFPAALRLAGA